MQSHNYECLMWLNLNMREWSKFNAFDLHSFILSSKGNNIFVASKSCISESQQAMNFPFYLKSTLEHIEKDTMQIVTKPK